MSALLRLQVAAQGFPLDDVVRTRLVLEDAVVQVLAAASDRDTSRAHELLEAMDARGLAPAEFLALDAQLHLSLAEASGNTVIAAMMAGLRSSIESYVQAGVSAIPDWEAMATRLRSEHRALVAAIDAADVEAARALVHTHITGYYTSAGLTRDTHPRPERHIMVQRQFPNPVELLELMKFKKPELDGRKRRLEEALTIDDLRLIAKRRTLRPPSTTPTERPKASFPSLARARRSRMWSSTPASSARRPRSTRASRSSAGLLPCRSESRPPDSRV